MLNSQQKLVFLSFHNFQPVCVAPAIIVHVGAWSTAVVLFDYYFTFNLYIDDLEKVCHHYVPHRYRNIFYIGQGAWSRE